MFEDDRPIKPDPKYLEHSENILKQQLKKNSARYLQKGNPLLLPCYKQSKPHHQNHSLDYPQKLTKAQQYQLIKKKNRQKFGQWDRKPIGVGQNVGKDVKKIKPSQITVNYKPKVVNIDTREYKNPKYVENPQRRKNEDEKREEMEYKTMIQYMKRMYGQFEKEKEQFEKEKEYLKFKKVIEKQEGLDIKPKISTGLNQPESKSRTNLQNKMLINNTEMKQEDGIEQPNESMHVQQFHYPIDKLHECNPFTIREIYKYVHAHQLVPENTQFYQRAKQIIEQERGSGKVKIIKPNCTHGSIGANHSVCSKEECAEKRITKFSAGWFELWVAGSYRTVYNQITGYKLVWYSNGDIKQEFIRNKIEIYHSKVNKVVQVKVGENLPFWYYPYIGQLEMKNAKGETEVIFQDGRHQIVLPTSKSEF